MTVPPSSDGWGCTLQGFHLERRGNDGRVSFELSVPDALSLTVGRHGPSLLPVTVIVTVVVALSGVAAESVALTV